MRTHRSLPLSIGLLAALAMASPAPAQSPSVPPPMPPTPAPAQNPPAPPDADNKPKDAPAKPAPKKVYTNDDLGGGRRGEVSVVGNSKTAAKPAQTATNEPKNEQYWHNRAQKLRNDMAAVDREIAQLQAENQGEHSASGNSSGTNPPPPPTSAYYGGSRASNQYQNQLRKLNNRKAQIQEQMDQLEEEAHKANVPPGWLR